LLVVSIAGTFSLSSLAAATGDKRVTEKVELAGRSLLNEPAATLVASGYVAINGYAAQTGATVLSGSQISTRRDAIASIDIGHLGRVVLRPETSIQLTLTSGTARIKTESERVRVVVLRGELSVASNRGNYALAAGEDAEFAGAVELTLGDGTVFAVQNQNQSQAKNSSTGQDPNQSGTNTPPPSKKRRYTVIPWWGYVAFAGVAGGIAAGVITDHDSGRSNRISNAVP